LDRLPEEFGRGVEIRLTVRARDEHGFIRFSGIGPSNGLMPEAPDSFVEFTVM
jgi:hypothetical protein